MDPEGLCALKAWLDSLLDWWNENANLDTLDDASNALMMNNPIPDISPVGLLDQGVGLVGVGAVKAVKAAKAINQANKGKIFVIGEAAGTSRVKDAALAIGGKFYEALKTVEETGLAKAVKNNYQAMRRKFLQGYKLKDMRLHQKQELRGQGYFYKWEEKWKKRWGWK